MIENWQEALNAGDVDLALSFLADDASIAIVPPAPGMPGEFSGKDEIRAWYEPQAAGNAQSEVHDIQVDGDQFVVHLTWQDDDMRGLGVELDFVIEGVLQDGKIQSYTATMREESLQAMEAAMAAMATAEPEAQLDPALTAEIEALVEQAMAANEVPGMALGVVKDGELVYAQGFGVTNLDNPQPVTPETLFQLAETSMTPTAMAVLLLVDQGKLDLDAPVTDVLPYFELADESYRDITIRQLLIHKSGIPDSGDAMADWENFMPQYDAGATERWVRTLNDTGLLFEPGEGFEYSDLGYALLGDVIAKASGQSYYTLDTASDVMGMLLAASRCRNSQRSRQARKSLLAMFLAEVSQD